MSINGGNDLLVAREGAESIYLAGGCFWGLEKLMWALPGVQGAVSGYANGAPDIVPTYESVCDGQAGFKETVRVIYDPSVIGLRQVLSAYFLVIDSTVRNRQGNDKGSQYQTGVYYDNLESERIVEEVVAVETKRHDVFAVEHEPLQNFFEAEEYHQDYLGKNRNGYCHIPAVTIDEVVALVKAEISYARPSNETLRKNLTPLQYDVTHGSATERAFTGAYSTTRDSGIYVDVATGQPLFKSSDKYESGCGWPSFSEPITAGSVAFRRDTSHGMERVEVRSATGDSHLGHVFEDDPGSPNGVRYCINSAALRFIPVTEMEEQGYGAYRGLFAD